MDVTDALRPEGNVLEVLAENVPASSRWYPGSGIFRDVTVRVCPPDHVKPNSLFVRTLEATERSARVAVSFEWSSGVSNFEFTVENPRLWSPESPSLYELELFGEKFRYGIRTAEFDPQRGFFLNGVHRQLRGVCLHHDLGPIGAAFDRDFARRQLALLKEMGCDAIRTSHNPPAAALLDLCDE
ncbi:MAG: beta-galactosidase, partial [Kiritimatiellae bacterium]|nr:beta-galactosidase [Kiritimatiellia bacterium]